MAQWFINFLIVLVFFIGMEGVAWVSHKYIMHGILWSFHRDHHHKTHQGSLERNDFFFLIFAIPGIICLLAGTAGHISFCLFAGIGITLYGACYFFIHDIFIHQRLKFLRKSQNRYLAGIRRAHKIHHKHTGKENGECFGMLWIPRKYFYKSTDRLI